jgi:UDP-2,3-diacylglucosamine pyrophosphatase LpxH
MKVFLSDLHIGDGSTKDDFYFDNDIINLLNDLYYLPKVELHFVGDLFELLESSTVREIELHPMNKLIEVLDESIIKKIEKAHFTLFSALRKFSTKHKVRYIIGNHDYYILKNKKMRGYLLNLFPKMEILPHYYDEEYGIWVQHGNQYDITNRFNIDKNGELIFPLGDYLARYNMKHFEKKLYNSPLPKDIIKDYDNVRPNLDVFLWFKYIDKKFNLKLTSEWLDSFVRMIKSDGAKYWLKKNFPFLRVFTRLFVNKTGGIIFGSYIVNSITKRRMVKKTSYLFNVAKRLFTSHEFPENRLNEKDVLGYSDEVPEIDYKNLNFIIFGHTHSPFFRGLNVDGKMKYYINTGAWKPVVERVGRYTNEGFLRKNELSYVILKKSGNSIEAETKLINKVVL